MVTDHRSGVDVVVVGGGNNGLMLGAYLAKAGLETLVLEARDFVGGGIVTREATAPGFQHDLAATVVGLVDFNPLIAQDELGLVKRSGLTFLPPPEVQEVQIFPDDRALTVYTDLDKTCASIEQFSAKDAEAVRKLYEIGLPMLGPVLRGGNNPPMAYTDYLKIISDGPGGAETLRTSLMSAVDFLNEWFESDYVKIMLTRWAGIARITPYEAGTANAVLFELPLHLKYGMKLVQGGAGKFTEALAEAITAYGGTIRTNAPVKQVIIENNRTAGVILADGEKITAKRAIVASNNVKSLFPDMVPGAELPDGFVDWVKRLRPQRVQYYTIHLATNEAPNYRAGGDTARSLQVHISGTTGYEEYLSGMLSLYRGAYRTNSAGIITPTVFDPSRAPEGKHVLWINNQEPFYVEGGPVRWDELKEELTAGILKTVADRTTNMGPENIIGTHAVTPLDYTRWNPAWIEGDPSHLGGFAYQTMSNRPVPGWGAYNMPVEGLYMCGPSTHPGTGISAGARAPAKVILKDLGIDFASIV